MADEKRIPPAIQNAPGIVWKARETGWTARWQARTDLVRKGFRPATHPLWQGVEPTDAERAFISEQCQRLQSEMLIFSRGGIPIIGTYDGTIKGLCAAYQSDEDSPYHDCRYVTRKNYDHIILRIVADRGTERIEDVNARALKRWHEEWSASGTAMAHRLISMLRTLTTFGSTFLECKDCRSLKVVLGDMRFKQAPPRHEHLTAEQAAAIIETAHKAGFHSIALAQAFQFECTFRQKDVIGEYVPHSEPGTSEIIDSQFKWVRGLRWNEISDDFILKHTTSKRGKDIEIDLKLAPMVMEELKQFQPIPRSGPVIIAETTARPWWDHQFRRYWRKIATMAGVPKSVKNMDTRAGAITEATEAGADLESIKHAAAHSDISMTQRYARNQRGKTDDVLRKRAANRNKSGTENQ